MKKFDQLYRCHQCLDSRRTPISKQKLAEALECTPRSVERYIEDLQTYWEAPINFLPRRGYQYDPEQREKWQVPGLWMTREESQKLLLLLNILNSFGNGLLNEELKGVHTNIDRILQRRGVDRVSLENRIRILPIAHRTISDHQINRILNALVDRKRVRIRYEDFQSHRTVRTISPQRLVYYKDNWYVDSWCHKAAALRTFSIARIEWSESDDTPAEKVSDTQLDNHFKFSYGIFAGEPDQQAVLRFLPPVATEIARQQWHPRQSGRWEKKHYILSIPYSNPTELKQDILKHLPNVVVEAPAVLQKEIRTTLLESLTRHQNTV